MNHKWMLFGAVLGVAGCVSHSCELTQVNSQCRAEHLLLQSDMLQAKLLITQNRPQDAELARALLQRAAANDDSGEAQFYQAVLLIRQQGNTADIEDLLRDAARLQHPLAIALLAERNQASDPEKAERYRASYQQLDVAKSGYPSFPEALVVVRALVTPH